MAKRPASAKKKAARSTSAPAKRAKEKSAVRAQPVPTGRRAKKIGVSKASPPADVIKHRGSFLWEGISRQTYKDIASHWAGVSRTEIVALAGSKELPFHVRYFEIAPAGFSTREFHQHEHIVLVVRGEGTVELGSESHSLGVGDVVRVRSGQVHQFLHRGGKEPFGFYCIVAADRDRPQVVGGVASACEWPGPKGSPTGPRKK
jgi:quercetin dioxygenase-like cupin family protein